jgi:hypothetical protein
MRVPFVAFPGLLERSAANKDKYNKERLDSYYRRNYQVRVSICGTHYRAPVVSPISGLHL